MVDFVSRSTFGRLARTQKLASPVALRKAAACQVVEAKAGDVPGATIGETKPRWLKFTISTGRVDRYGDTVAVSGWKLDEFRRNPVVLWAHNSTILPVAKALNVWTEGEALLAVAEFPTAELSPFADQVYRFLQAGYLQACSVGFAPSKWSWVESAERPLGIDFQEQELWEFSVCPIPANPDALLEQEREAPAADQADQPAPSHKLARELELVRLRRQRLGLFR